MTILRWWWITDEIHRRFSMIGGTCLGCLPKVYAYGTMNCGTLTLSKSSAWALVCSGIDFWYSQRFLDFHCQARWNGLCRYPARPPDWLPSAILRLVLVHQRLGTSRVPSVPQQLSTPAVGHQCMMALQLHKENSRRPVFLNWLFISHFFRSAR